MNDVIPYYVKDFNNCMRYTAIYSIEMKLFLFLPILVLAYHKGHKLLATLCSISMIMMSFCLNIILFQYYEFMPGYLIPFDPLAFDLYVLKPWTHIDSYFSGILLGFAFYEFKKIKIDLIDQDKH